MNADGSYTYVVNDANVTVNALSDASQTLDDVFTYVASDLANATSTATLTITIKGANDAPVAQADTETAIEAGTVVPSNATGSVLQNDSDADANDKLTVTSIAGSAAGTIGGSTTGMYGTLTLNADGSYTYVVDDANATVNALWLATDTLADVFTYAVIDNSGASASSTLKLTITGSNDAPVALSDTRIVTRASTANVAAASGLLSNDSDVDTAYGDTFGLAQMVQGGTTQSVMAGTPGVITSNYGTLTVNTDGSYSYVADGAASLALTFGTSAIDTFTYTIKDANGETASATLALTISNDTKVPPVAVPDSKTAIEDGVIPGSGASDTVLTNDYDPDSSDPVSVAGIANGALNTPTAGQYGSLTLKSDGSYSYSVDNLNASVNGLYKDTLSDVFTYTLSDADGETSVSTITITIQGADDAPVLASPIADQSGKFGTALTLLNVAGNFTAVDTGDTLTYSLPGAPAWLSIDSTTGAITGTPAAAGDFDITVEATDGASNSIQDTYKLSVTADPVVLLASQSISGEGSLDVTSPIVLKFSEDISLGTGEIRIMDDMGINGFTVKHGSSYSLQDKHDNDVVLGLTDGVVTSFTVGGIDKFSDVGTSLSVSGSMLIINPSGDHSYKGNKSWNFDWDFGAKYHIELDEGVVTSTTTGASSDAVTSPTALAFSTVAPIDNGSATASKKMDTTTGETQSSYLWHNGHIGADSPGTGIPLDFEIGAHAIVIINTGYPTRNAQMGGEVYIENFGFSGTTLTADDLIYNDNLGDMNMVSTDSIDSHGDAATWNKYDATKGVELNRALSGSIDGNHRINFNQTDHTAFFASSNGSAITNDTIFEDANHYNANVIVFG